MPCNTHLVLDFSVVLFLSILMLIEIQPTQKEQFRENMLRSLKVLNDFEKHVG